jgi:tRNA(Leu) C34 or U34 (ribose-2'-O)-methylase TrmL
MGNPTVNYKDIISQTTSEHYNVRDEYKHNTVETNKNVCQLDSLDYGIGAFSVTGDLNIGMMIRSATLLGARDFFIFGRRKYDKRSTVGAQNYINIHKFGNTVADITKACTNFSYFPVFIEHGGTPLPLNVGDWEDIEDMDIINNFRPMFIFGSESNGIPNDILDSFPYCKILSIPQRGVLRSFNVSSTMAIVCWEYSKLFIHNIR